MTELTKAEQRTRTALTICINAGHPVALALETMRADAITSAAKCAKDRCDRAADALKEAGNDVNVCAPYPRYDAADRDAKYARASFFSSITTQRPSQYNTNAPRPCFVDVDAERVAKFIEDAKVAAAIQYDAFALKLIGKVGECDDATISGNHVWDYSFLKVVKGELTETWKTQQITNYSKLGRYYPQWPSRKLKR